MSSTRDLEAKRERIAFEQQFNEQQRTNEDKEQYDIYAKRMRSEGLAPLPFSEWRSFIPKEFKNSPSALRGEVASAKATWNTAVLTMRDMVANRRLSDETLADLGFDPNDRFQDANLELDDLIIRAVLEKWIPTEPRFDRTVHIDALSDFFKRNRLFFTVNHLARAFSLLWNMGLFPPKPEPAPELAKPEGVNEHGVNLGIEPDPQGEAERKGQEYGTRVVAVGPDGKEYTQYQLDRLSADEFKQVMRLVGDRLPKFSNVIGVER